MLYYERNNCTECIICHYWYFKQECKFQKLVCNGCHNFLMLSLNISNVSIIIVKGIDYRFIISNISKFDAIHLLGISGLNDCGSISNGCLKN